MSPLPVQKALKNAGTELDRLGAKAKTAAVKAEKTVRVAARDLAKKSETIRKDPRAFAMDVVESGKDLGEKLTKDVKTRVQKAGEQAARRAEDVTKMVGDKVGSAVEMGASPPERPHAPRAPHAVRQGRHARQEDRHAQVAQAGRESPPRPLSARGRDRIHSGRLSEGAPFRSREHDRPPRRDPGCRPSRSGERFRSFPPPLTKKLGLVCAGGGVTGAIYEIGALAALEDRLENASITDFDVFVGVSAGAYISALLANGVTPSLLFRNATRSADARTDIDDLSLFRAEPRGDRARVSRRPRSRSSTRPGTSTRTATKRLSPTSSRPSAGCSLRLLPQRRARGVDARLAHRGRAHERLPQAGQDAPASSPSTSTPGRHRVRSACPATTTSRSRRPSPPPARSRASSGR